MSGDGLVLLHTSGSRPSQSKTQYFHWFLATDPVAPIFLGGFQHTSDSIEVWVFDVRRHLGGPAL